MLSIVDATTASCPLSEDLKHLPDLQHTPQIFGALKLIWIIQSTFDSCVRGRLADPDQR